jgi:hypothetical protein
MKYRSGYKYQLAEDYEVFVDICPEEMINTPYLSLMPNGYLTIRQGYAWDGPSGPTFDTKTFMRGALVHDALYQLMRWDLLHSVNRAKADLELQRLCLEDGMWSLRAKWVYRGVRLGGGPAASPESRKRIETAP